MLLVAEHGVLGCWWSFQGYQQEDTNCQCGSQVLRETLAGPGFEIKGLLDQNTYLSGYTLGDEGTHLDAIVIAIRAAHIRDRFEMYLQRGFNSYA